MPDAITLSYGASTSDADGVAPAVTLWPGRPLRLSDGPYPFPEPPDLFRLSAAEDRLGFLREHLQSLCGLWDRPARGFLAAYFASIAAAIADATRELEALAAATGGLFSPADWSFAALRPLPQAHLPDGNAMVRADFAFWTGAELVAVELLGSATPRRQRGAELARLAGAGVGIVEISASALARDGAAVLHRLLPPPFQRFWQGVRLPESPFAPPTLDAIRRAGDDDQSFDSIT